MNAGGEIDIDHLGRSLSLGLRGLRRAEEHNPQRCNCEVQKRNAGARQEQNPAASVVGHDDLLPPGDVVWLHCTLMMISGVTWANCGAMALLHSGGQRLAFSLLAKRQEQ